MLSKHSISQQRLFVIYVCMLLVVACSDGEKQNNKSISLYTSVPLKAVEFVKQEYERANPGVLIKLNRAGTAALISQIKEEGARGQNMADVIWLADFSAAEELKEEGYLKKYSPPNAKAVIPIFIDNEGYYTGSRLLNMVIVYNRKLVKQVPKGYWDMVNPQFRRKIGIVNPETSGSSIYMISTLLQNRKYDWEYLSKLYLNGCKITQNNAELISMVANGELAMGIAIDYAVRKYISSNVASDIDYVYPAQGTVSVVSPLALGKNPGDEVLARKFIDWILSKEGQLLLSRKMNMVSVREDIPLPEGIDNLGQLKVIPSRAKSIYRHKSANLKLYRDVFSGKTISDIFVDSVEDDSR